MSAVPLFFSLTPSLSLSLGRRVATGRRDTGMDVRALSHTQAFSRTHTYTHTLSCFLSLERRIGSIRYASSRRTQPSAGLFSLSHIHTNTHTHTDSLPLSFLIVLSLLLDAEIRQ